MKFYVAKYTDKKFEEIAAEETLTYISEESYLKGIYEKSLDSRKSVICMFKGGFIIFEI